ncbi:GmrSD restriction endonuclease domain-containing protein [Nocardia thailandica]|uniref:DUF262 domain-containing protein n=1 Tax=Nocardia thailandica TaxID=257275 RepID=A0ABW6PID5_9NOCA|nr:DUF262 domain-containing protein [Nocardia thailandica]
MTRLSTLLDQIDSGAVLLPEFQRGYVWNRDQVRGLMRSLYLGYPIGGLLVWETGSGSIAVRGTTAKSGLRLLLLDGQQRITTLYGIVRGTAPSFFEGDANAFTGLHFDVEREAFEFHTPGKVDPNPVWIDVTELFEHGPMHYLQRFTGADEATLATYLDRLNKLREITNRDFTVETITGADRTVDEVVDIFNRVNSGGTKLSKGDLALATLCAQWPQARGNLRDHLVRWDKDGYVFSLDWLLRNVIAVGTGRAAFDALGDLAPEQFEEALAASARHVDTFLDAASGRLGLDHDRVLMGRYAIPVIARLLEVKGGRFDSDLDRDRTLYWYIHSALWGRFSGSTETALQQDFDTAERGDIDPLISTLELSRGGSLDIYPDDFNGSTRGSRFYPLLYLLARVDGARDLGSGLLLGDGEGEAIQVHHLFPKGLLRDAGYDRNEINAIANFCFLTQPTESQLTERDPAEYFAEAEARTPGVLASQWIPTDPRLWSVENYPEFLAARRRLLAAAAQQFLEELRRGTATYRAALEPMRVAGFAADDPVAAQVNALVDDLAADGYAFPLLDAEVADPVTGRELAVAEAFWPDGLQQGLGMPVVLKLDPATADLTRLAQLGYAVFTSADALRGYVSKLRAEVSGETIAAPAAPVGDIAVLAGRLPDTWMGNAEQIWLRFAWQILEDERAARPDPTATVEQQALRYIALWALTRTFFTYAFDEGKLDEWRFYLGEVVGPHPLIPHEWLVERATTVPGIAPRAEDLAMTLVNDVVGAAYEVSTTLLNQLGGAELFASLWASSGAAEHYGYPLSTEQIGELVSEVVSDPTPRKIQAYSWIEEGMAL